MSNRTSTGSLSGPAAAAAVAGVLLLAPALPAGQDGGGWTVGRTPWGHPDLQGAWSSRPTTLERAALVVDPPDGRIPYSAEGRRRAAREPADRADPFANLEALTTYCAFSRIVQSPDAVAMHHEAGRTGGAYRTIPLGRRRHNPAHVRQWRGDPVGRWEGDTLVVDSTNFSDRRSVEGATLRLVERFTRVAPDRILYRATVENPLLYSRPWTIEMPWTRVPDAPRVGEQQAVGIAERQVLFTPEAAAAELAADAEPPVWRVTLRGRRPGGSLFAFEEATVTVDARSGDVLGVESR